MTQQTKFKMFLYTGIVFITISIIILILGDGLRRWYSGIFFLIMGGVSVANAIIRYRSRE